MGSGPKCPRRLHYTLLTTCETNNCNTYILLNITRIKEKSYTKCGGETIPRNFSKNSKLNISLYQ